MHIELQPLERLAPGDAIGVGQQNVGAEADQGANWVRFSLADRAIEVAGRHMVRARRSEWTLGETQGRRHAFCRGQLFAGDRRSRRRREQHISAKPVEAAGQGIEQ